MKHIRKIISISIALNSKFGFSVDKISEFITVMSAYEYAMQKINELLCNGNKGLAVFVQERLKTQKEITDYLLHTGVIGEVGRVRFSHNPTDVPIKINLGLKYANHSDDVSFVINL